MVYGERQNRGNRIGLAVMTPDDRILSKVYENNHQCINPILFITVNSVPTDSLYLLQVAKALDYFHGITVDDTTCILTKVFDKKIPVLQAYTLYYLRSNSIIRTKIPHNIGYRYEALPFNKLIECARVEAIQVTFSGAADIDVKRTCKLTPSALDVLTEAFGLCGEGVFS